MRKECWNTEIVGMFGVEVFAHVQCAIGHVTVNVMGFLANLIVTCNRAAKYELIRDLSQNVGNHQF